MGQRVTNQAKYSHYHLIYLNIKTTPDQKIKRRLFLEIYGLFFFCLFKQCVEIKICRTIADNEIEQGLVIT